MKPSSVCLPKSEIPLLLAGDLTPDEAASAESHIAECESCRSTIESMIADSRWWDDARKSLVASATRSPLQLEISHDTEPTTTAKLLDLLGPTDDPNMLGRIGPYEIIGLLGQGGMGAVFKGFDRSLNRFVAIKMLLPHLAASGAARKRFAREGQAVAAVVDDHVMAIHCVDEWQGVPYLVMTYSRGVSLQKRLSDNGPLEVRETLRIGMQAAKGLAAAHAQGIVHRDIKPANIFLDQNVERVQLMDFGLARAVDDASLTRSGTLAGTPQYMSPEQARAETVDHRSDLFSLGSVMYAMCTGHAPFRAESSYSVLRLITDKEPRPIREINPDMPEWLCAIISKLMAKQADERFGSAKEVAEVLEECLAHVQRPQAMPLPEKVIALAPKMVRRPPISKFIGVAAFAFSLIFAGVLVVLELNKGTLTIESDAEDVPIRIMQGEKIVDRMTVTKAGNSVRVAAGNYKVELDATMDSMVVENNKIVLSRGTTERVRIRYSSTEDRAKSDETAVDDKSGPSTPVFKTPEALMKYVADCQNREDVAGYLSCLTDEPVKQIASGYLLLSVSMLQEFTNDPNAHRPPNYAERMQELEQVVRDAVSDKDVAPSALAFATASGRMKIESNSQDFEESATRFMQDPLLHLLANITVDRIKDPRRFIVRFDAIELEDARSKEQKVRKEFDYVLEQDGDKAIATNKSDGSTTSLIKTANGWRINDPWYGVKAKDDLGAAAAMAKMQQADGVNRSGTIAPGPLTAPESSSSNSNALFDSEATETSDCAVVMVMHTAELPKGNTIQRSAATKVIGMLTDTDYVGILLYGSGKSGTNWLWGDYTELSQIGANRDEWLSAIAESKSGDFPSLEPAFTMTVDVLQKVKAKQKLVIVLTDGDPLFVDATLIDRFRDAEIKVSVIHVDSHLTRENPLLKRLAEATGGTYHYALESQASVVETLFVREVKSLRSSSRAALQKIGVAFHRIHDKVGAFPGSRMRHLDRQNNEFEHPHSWRVAILPYIGEQQLFDRYRFDEPWDSANNTALLKEMPDLYRSPHAPRDQHPGDSNMLGIATERGGLGLKGGEAIFSFTDGASNTILIVETAHSVPWTKPEDLTESNIQPIAGHSLQFVLADGSVGEMNPIDTEKLAKMITRNGGEVIATEPVDKCSPTD